MKFLKKIITSSIFQQVWVYVTNVINPNPRSSQHTYTAFEDCWVHSRSELMMKSTDWIWTEWELWFTAYLKALVFPHHLRRTWDFISTVCLLLTAQGTGGVAGRDPCVSSCHDLGKPVKEQLNGCCVRQFKHRPLYPAKHMPFNCCCI